MAELCARLEVEQPDAPGGKGVIYVKSRWFSTRFSLCVSDGLDAWSCEAREEEVFTKASNWDWTVSKYLEEAEKYLGVQDPTSTYSFGDARSPLARKLSWTLEKDGVPLVANWRLEKSGDPREITRSILDCLMQGSSRISEELQRKKRSLELMKAEAERAQAQSQKFKDQKIQFEADIYKKFVAVLNSKKGKLRQLREQALQSVPAEARKGKDEMVDDTESEDELDESEEEDDYPSKERTVHEGSGQGTEKDGDEDSDKTDIWPSDSPMADVSSMDPVLPHSVFHEIDKTKGELNVPVTQPSTLRQPTEGVTDAATLLSGSTYTSAPRKRRLL